MFFEVCLKELIKSKENELSIMEKEFNGLKNVNEDTYFNNLSMDKNGLDEETQADEEMHDIFDKKIDKIKRITKKKIEEAFQRIRERNKLIKRLRKEVAEENK